jgi:hypothetical protein
VLHDARDPGQGAGETDAEAPSASSGVPRRRGQWRYSHGR